MSSYLISAALTNVDEADKYRYNCSCGCGIDMREGLPRYSLRLVKALSHSSVHLNCLAPFKAWKKGWHLSEHLEMKRLNAATIPVSFCISFIVVGARISRRAAIFFWIHSPVVDQETQKLSQAYPKGTFCSI